MGFYASHRIANALPAVVLFALILGGVFAAIDPVAAEDAAMLLLVVGFITAGTLFLRRARRFGPADARRKEPSRTPCR